MLKWISPYFGNAYIRYFLLFSWCKNLSCNNACNTHETTWFFVIYDLWFHEFVMLKPTLNNLMMNCFCGMVDWQKVFSLISSQNHCQRSSPSQISDTLRAGFEPVQNLSSDLVEWSCVVLITATPWCHLTIPDSALILEFIVINYCMFQSTTLSLIFFWFNKCQKTWQKWFMKPQHFRDCCGPWHLKHLGFFTNYLKLVNLIPVSSN